MGGRLCESYRRRKRDNGEYSLDTDAGYESDVIHRPQTPDEHLEEQERETALYDALAQLPPSQARRVYRHYILGMSKSAIAAAENVSKGRVSHSIEQGLKNLQNILKNVL
jgi:RNA polymerase sigma-70 factor (ECF subfamily)